MVKTFIGYTIIYLKINRIYGSPNNKNKIVDGTIYLKFIKTTISI